MESTRTCGGVSSTASKCHRPRPRHLQFTSTWRFKKPSLCLAKPKFLCMCWSQLQILSLTLSQGTNVETEWSQSVVLGTLSPLTSLSAFDLHPSLTPQPMPASQDWSESVPSDSLVPVQPALRCSTRAARGGNN
jgi:hypothetical protein